MSYQLAYKDQGFIVTFWGEITLNDLNKANGEIHGHEEFDNHRFQIIDLREADLSNVNMKDTQEPASMDVIAASTNDSVRLALVVSDSKSLIICQEFAEQSKEMGSPWSYSIFRTYEGAIKWGKNEK